MVKRFTHSKYMSIYVDPELRMLFNLVCENRNEKMSPTLASMMREHVATKGWRFGIKLPAHLKEAK